MKIKKDINPSYAYSYVSCNKCLFDADVYTICVLADAKAEDLNNVKYVGDHDKKLRLIEQAKVIQSV